MGLINDMEPLPALLEQQAVGELMALNNETSQYGMTLSANDARELIETRGIALRSFGRVEFGGGVIGKLIEKFSDSPYLHQHNYASTLHDLIEAFYYFKNESLDRIGDDELIDRMKEDFDGSCRGSVELLLGRELEALARGRRFEDFDFPDEEENWEPDEEIYPWDDRRWNFDQQ